MSWQFILESVVFLRCRNYRVSEQERFSIYSPTQYVLLTLNLHEVYQKIIAPIRIGEGGYSVTKDRDLAIIVSATIVNDFDFCLLYDYIKR